MNFTTPRNALLTILCMTAALLSHALLARADGESSQTQPAQRNAPRGPQGIFRTDVPEHALDVILTRPTATSITVSILCYADAQVFIAYGPDRNNLNKRTPMRELKQGEPAEIVLRDLLPNTRYCYQVRDVSTDKPLPGDDELHTFVTQRSPGSSFVFTVQADSHLDENTNPELYRRSLLNALSAGPDFHIDLGDTFMVDKHPNRESAAKQYLAQRYYFGLLGHSAPVFLVLGNHDGEEGKLLRGGAESLAVWSNTMRKRYFPNPMPDDFYSGNATIDPLAGKLQDYYAWTWGDAQFIALNPYWYSRPSRNDDRWGMSLGRQQYDWLKNTLENSKARFRFVFIHQLVGGLDNQGRGGVEGAPFGEWGGKNADGTEGFAGHRTGWDAPIHALLVRHHVTAVFHGHDHLYARQELDGVIYQKLPQPGFPGRGYPRQATEYGYTNGTILGGAGHLRVTVSDTNVNIEFIQSSLSR